jgi:hypothetical protein
VGPYLEAVRLQYHDQHSANVVVIVNHFNGDLLVCVHFKNILEDHNPPTFDVRQVVVGGYVNFWACFGTGQLKRSQWIHR